MFVSLPFSFSDRTSPSSSSSFPSLTRAKVLTRTAEPRSGHKIQTQGQDPASGRCVQARNQQPLFGLRPGAPSVLPRVLCHGQDTWRPGPEDLIAIADLRLGHKVRTPDLDLVSGPCVLTLVPHALVKHIAVRNVALSRAGTARRTATKSRASSSVCACGWVSVFVLSRVCVCMCV